MDNIRFTALDPNALANTIAKMVIKELSEKNRRDFEKQTFSIKETAGILKRSESFVRSRIADGTFQTTADGKFISGAEINNYLSIKNAVSGNETA